MQHCDAMMCLCMLSCVWHFATPWTVARQAPLSMGFPRQEYWSFHFLHGLNPRLLCLLHRQEDSLPLSHLGSPKQLYSNLKKEKEKRKLVEASKRYFTACYITQGLKEPSELFVLPQVRQVNTWKVICNSRTHFSLMLIYDTWHFIFICKLFFFKCGWKSFDMSSLTVCLERSKQKYNSGKWEEINSPKKWPFILIP